jgi:hypothetical protein
MTRRGKIARLPRNIRDQLNRRIQNGEQGKRLLPWLNSLQKVKAVLKEEFNNQPISPQNLSEWRDGGYRDWLLQQQTIDHLSCMQADSVELTKAAKTTLSDLLAQRLAAQFVILAQRLNQSTARGAPDTTRLHELCADIVALRKCDQREERLKLERKRLGFEPESDSPDRERDEEKIARKWAKEHNCEIRPNLTEAEKHQRLMEIFHMDPQYDPMSQAAPATMKQPDDPPSAQSQPDPMESNLIKPDQTNLSDEN